MREGGYVYMLNLEDSELTVIKHENNTMILIETQEDDVNPRAVNRREQEMVRRIILQHAEHLSTDSVTLQTPVLVPMDSAKETLRQAAIDQAYESAYNVAYGHSPPDLSCPKKVMCLLREWATARLPGDSE